LAEVADKISGSRVTVLGAGRSGTAVAELLHKKGAEVFLSEEASIDEKQDAAEFLERIPIQSEFGGHTSRVFKADWLVVSPGVPLSSPVIQTAKEKGIPIFGELEVASWFCRAPIIGITGSNGKSTTTVLLGEIFKKSGRPCIVAGNIGQPFSKYVEKTYPDGVAVVEVSSFQLETIQNFHPEVAVFLNLTPDHLNRHGSMENYGRIKSQIFKNQTPSDYAVVNGQDSFVIKLARNIKSKRIIFGTEDKSTMCGFVRDDALTIRLNEKEEEILPVGELGIKGEHNVLNSLAAALAALVMDVDLDDIRSTLRNFRGLPHRMEFVREVNGVRWVNDSKATNVDSVWYALRSFSSPVILIAGGRDKDSDFTSLRERIKEKVRGIILIGEAADKMEKAFKDLKPMLRASSLKEAVDRARKMANSGDVVLLSPGCASFDMFKNFEDRGKQFKALVKEL